MPAYVDPTPKPISADTIFLAFELSGTSWLVALHAPDADKVERHRLPAGVAAEVLGLIARTKARVTRRLGTTPRVACCYEGTYTVDCSLRPLYVGRHRRVLWPI